MPELINYLYDDTITIYYTVPSFMYFMSFMYFYENCNHCKIVLWPFPHPLGLHPEMDKRKNKDDDDDDDLTCWSVKIRHIHINMPYFYRPDIRDKVAE